MRPMIVLATALVTLTACDPFAGVPYIETDPVQVDFESFPSWRLDDFTLEGVATYELDAVVLSRKNYRFGRMSGIAPYDLALGWGPMSDGTVLSELKFSQAHRWYFFRWNGTPPASETDMQTHSANVHIIPADRSVRAALRGVGAGDVVRLRGRLVDVYGPEGEEWKTSRRRDDTGDGACEIFHVEEATVFR